MSPRRLRTAKSIRSLASARTACRLFWIVGATDGSEHQLQPCKLLQRVVMELPGPPCSLGLGCCDAAASSLLCDVLRRGNGRGRAGGEPGQDVLVRGAEDGGVPQAVEGCQDAEDSSPESQRHEEARLGPCLLLERAVEPARSIVEPLGPAGAKHLATDASLERDALAEQIVFEVTVRAATTARPAWKQYDHRPRIREVPAPA